MYKFLLLPLLLLFQNVAIATGGDDVYAVSRIPEALLKNADAVLRLEELKFELQSLKEATFTNHYVITILNENGEDWAQLTEYYDKLRNVESVEGILYDATGKQLKKMRNKDLQDLSGVDDNSLMDDNRLKKHNFYYKVFPYTIEYEIVIHYKSTLFFPSWVPAGAEKISVEKSSITYILPQDYNLHYKTWNYKNEPVASTDKNKKILTWSVEAMPAIIKEPYAPDWHELTTYVAFAPSDFQVDDYKGNMNSWQDFGKFVYALKTGRDQLPDAMKQKIHQAADAITDPKKRIEVLYALMQSHTRYISIQLGIGGWQPFNASFVSNKGYGDCKALTNYMYSILKESGINSYYTLIRAGDGQGRINDDFPSQQFNHVILCVPLQKDTTWLECTSQTHPAGYLGSFTCDRYGLLVDETGGKLVRTPIYKLKENLQVRNVKAKLENDGTLKVLSASRYYAIQQDYLHGMLNALTKEKQKEYLQRQLDFSTYDINSFEYLENKSSMPSINEILDLTVRNYASITGKRLFIVPNIMSKTGQKLKADETRKYDIVLKTEYQDIDSAEIELPAGFDAESVPQDVVVDSKFGKYTESIKLKGNIIFYYRNMQQYSGRFPAASYKDWVAFTDAIYKADRNKIVLVKKEGDLKPF